MAICNKQTTMFFWGLQLGWSSVVPNYHNDSIFFYVLGSVKQYSILKQLQIKCVCCKVTCYVFGFCKGKFGLSLMLNIGTQLPENDSWY